MATASAPLQCTPNSNKFSPNNTQATPSPQEGQSPHGTQWHFPGPSSRFNQRERASTQSRTSPITHAIAPSLYTERRAHRRAHSSYQLPTSVSSFEQLDRSVVRKGLNARFTSPHSPSLSTPVRSPLSRFPSFTTAMAVTTPARASLSRLHDSPFSDYFTDDNRSIDEVASKTLPAVETQRLLVRLNKLQSALMRRGHDSQALYMVGRRMSEIESDMESLHSQSRQPPELGDSGLFMEEADDDAEEESAKQEYDTLDGAVDERPPTVVEFKSGTEAVDEKTNAWMAAQAQQILASVASAQKELQRRFEEMKELRERHQQDLRKKEKELRDKDTELQSLHTENEHMQQDLSLDKADFALLDGQLRLIQNQLLHNGNATGEDLESAVDAMRADCRKAMKWVTSKRVRYSNCRTRSGDQYDEDVKLGRWKMDVVRHPTGRVDSMYLERLPISNENDPASHFEISEISGKLVDRQRRPLYVDQACQADIEMSTSTVEDISLDSCESCDDDYDPRGELRQNALEDDSSDCAITTSPPSELGSGFTDDESMNGTKNVRKGTAITKSAWHELWNGMAEFAGVGEHRW